MTAASIRARALWWSCLLPLAALAANVDEPDRQAMCAQTAATEAFAIERARAALAEGDPRRAMIAAMIHDGRRRIAAPPGPADGAPATARRAALGALAIEAVAIAIARGADDPPVQLLLSQVCDQEWAACDADAAVARLTELEPGNGLAALVMLSRAHHRKDADGERAALRTLAGAERLDTHEVALLAAARDLVGNADVPAAMLGEVPEGLTAGDHRAMLVFGYWLAIPKHWLVGLGPRCRAAPPESDEREDCVSAARLLVAADDAISPSIGLALLEDLAVDPEERARIRQQRRDLDWQDSVNRELTRQVGEAPGSAAAHLDAMIAAGGEVALRTKLLSEAGIPLVAPADWAPSDPRLRD